MYVFMLDIDGTLLNAGGAGERAMLRVLSEVFGIQEVTGDIPTSGRTDAAITFDLFAEHGIAPERLAEFRQAYESELVKSIAECSGQVLPGAERLVETLAKEADIELGLLTGNFECAAWTKLSHYGLREHFPFGAFGDYHPNRDDVARVASEEIGQRFGNVADERVWIIGDTPADIQCARAINARVVAVATGSFSRNELDAHRPDILLDTLDEAATSFRDWL